MLTHWSHIQRRWHPAIYSNHRTSLGWLTKMIVGPTLSSFPHISHHSESGKCARMSPFSYLHSACFQLRLQKLSFNVYLTSFHMYHLHASCSCMSPCTRTFQYASIFPRSSRGHWRACLNYLPHIIRVAMPIWYLYGIISNGNT